MYNIINYFFFQATFYMSLRHCICINVVQGTESNVIGLLNHVQPNI